MPKNLEQYRLPKRRIGFLMAASSLLVSHSHEANQASEKIQEYQIDDTRTEDKLDRRVVIMSAAPPQVMSAPAPPPETTTTLPPPETTTTLPMVEVVEVAPTPVSGTAEEWMLAAGINPDDYGHVDFIMSKESGWNPSNVSSKGCIGLGQNCPDPSGGYWLKDACPDWQTNPVCQLDRFEVYAVGRYGSWAGAEAFWRANHWW